MKKYVLAWVALLGLTGISFGLARSGHGGVPAAFAIAGAKALVVAFAFMHVLEERGVGKVVLLVATIFVALLVGLATGDVVTRGEDLRGRPRGAARLPP